MNRVSLLWSGGGHLPSTCLGLRRHRRARDMLWPLGRRHRRAEAERRDRVDAVHHKHLSVRILANALARFRGAHGRRRRRRHVWEHRFAQVCIRLPVFLPSFPAATPPIRGSTQRLFYAWCCWQDIFTYVWQFRDADAFIFDLGMVLRILGGSQRRRLACFTLS